MLTLFYPRFNWNSIRRQVIQQLNFGFPRWRQLFARAGFELTSSMDIETRVTWLVKVSCMSNLKWP